MKSSPLVLDSQGLYLQIELIQYQLSDFDYKVVIKKKHYQSHSIKYLGIQLLHSVLVCLNIYKYMSFIFLLSLSQLASQLYIYNMFLISIRLFKIRYSTVSLIKELHLYSFKLCQQVLYFNKRRFCGKKTPIKLDMW